MSSTTHIKPRPIIFLDIDGVLNETKHASQLHFEPILLSRLHSILVQTDGIIVLTTFWRHFRDYIVYVFHRHGINVKRHMVVMMEKEEDGGGGTGVTGVTGGKQSVVEFLKGFRRSEESAQKGLQEGLQCQQEQVGDECCQYHQELERQCCDELTNEKKNDDNNKDGNKDGVIGICPAKDEAEYSSRAEEIEAWLKKYGERYLGRSSNANGSQGKCSNGSHGPCNDSERNEYDFHPNHWKYVILDDRPSAAKPDTPLFDRFVRTDTKLGLTEEDSERAIQLLLFGPQAS